jgi:LacI family transcriptional regulator
MTIAQEMGYQPNLIARQLQSHRTQTIGIITPPREHNTRDDFFSLLIKGISCAAVRQQYDVLVSAVLPDADELTAYRRIAGGRRVDGLVIARTYRDDPRIAYLKSIQFPFVVAGRLSSGDANNFPYIDADSQTGYARWWSI